MRLLKCSVVVLILLCLNSSSYGQMLEITADYWFSDIEGSVKVTEANVGTNVDLADDLGIGEEAVPELFLTLNISSSHRLRLAFLKAGFSGSQTLTRTVEFDGKTYSSGSLVNSDLDLDYLSLAWLWDLINIWGGKIKAGTVLEAKLIRAEAKLAAPGLSISESESLLAGLPSAGLTVSIAPVKRLEFFALVSAFSAGDYGEIVDGQAGVAFKLFSHGSLSAGYRFISIKAEDEPDLIDLELSGPFAGFKFLF